ncbi:hypothetical protein LCGC14_2919250, partial [marine sediment metagenome]
SVEACIEILIKCVREDECRIQKGLAFSQPRKNMFPILKRLYMYLNYDVIVATQLAKATMERDGVV